MHERALVMGEGQRLYKTTKEAVTWKLAAWAASTHGEETGGGDSSEADKAWQEARRAVATLDDMQAGIQGFWVGGTVWTLLEGHQVPATDCPNDIVASMMNQAAPGMNEFLSLESMAAAAQPIGTGKGNNKWQRGLKVKVRDWELVANVLIRQDLGEEVDNPQGMEMEKHPHVWVQGPEREEEDGPAQPTPSA